MFLLRETEHGKSWVKVLQPESSPILDAQKVVYRLQGAEEVPRDTNTPLFRCEESERFAMMSPDSQPFSALHRIRKSTLGKQNILWGIVRSWHNDWQWSQRQFYYWLQYKQCWWIHNILHGIFQKVELTEGFLTSSCLKSTCNIMCLNSEPYSHTHIHKNPSEEYFINTLNNSKEFWNVSILLLYLLNVPCWCWPNASHKQDAPSIY